VVGVLLLIDIMKQPEGATLLRTLTMKSTMKFGKYKDSTVGQVLGLGMEGIGYLVWVYYANSKVSFNNEVLDLMLVGEELRIEKPSKNTNKIMDWRKSLTDDQRLCLYHKRNKQEAFNQRTAKRSQSYNETSEALRSENHGNNRG